MDQDLSVKHETMKLLEENTEEILKHIDGHIDFLDKTPKVQAKSKTRQRGIISNTETFTQPRKQ